MKRAGRASLAATALFLAASCGPSGAPTGDATAPRRIVVMAPAAGEMIDALGATGQVVGVGDFVTAPAALAVLPRVGAYDAPSIERVLELGAGTLVTADSRAAAPAHARLRALGIEVLALDTSTFEGVFAALDALGGTLGRRALASEIAADMRRDLDRIRQRSAALPRRRVLFVVGRDPLFVAGPGSHADEMIALAGGINVVHDAAAAYARVSFESVLERQPEVIIDTSDNRPAALRGRQAGDWARWSFLPAVEAGRVYWVDPQRLVIPGIRLPEMTRLMARLIHPEAFGEARDEELSRAPGA